MDGLTGRLKALQGQKGFTLIELVVVIAILGVLAAITVPLVVNYLDSSKERSYTAERERIQAAVDAYYSAPDNTRFLGKRQYPVIGRAQTTQGTLTNRTTAITLLDSGDPFTAQDPDGAGPLTNIELWNPVGGTEGADLSAVWTDADTDGVREATDTIDSVAVTRGGVTYHTDPRYFFIDFEALVAANLMEDVPQTASTDNAPSGSTTTYSGNYSWYVNEQGQARSLYVELPSASGYQNGVFP